ncbi:MAG: hypothetical protein RLZZ381_1537 [Cyanobacteriota bacterium]|jgi:AcrR family transcriptional regulator
MSKSSSLSSNQSLRRQPQQKRGQQRVEKILLAAASVFAEGGYAAATVQQIADRASTSVGSIYQFFPDKLGIFQALLSKHIQQIDIIEAKFFAQDLERPLRQGIDEYIDDYISYFEHPIPRCVVLQYYLPPIPGLFEFREDLPELLIDSIKQHANFYRQRNPDLSQAKSELLSEVAHNLVQSLASTAIKSDTQHRQELYAEIKDVLFGYLNPHIGDHLLPNKMMICPHCQSDKIAKNGRQKNKQRYICKGCDRQFSDRYVERGYPLKIRQQCLDLHQQGISFREIERRTGVSHNTVINWAKNL